MTSPSGIENECNFFGNFLRNGDVTLDLNLCDFSRISLLSEFLQFKLDFG